VPKIKVIPYVSIYRYTKFGQFWTLGRPPFWISMFERLKILEIRIELGPACQSGPLLNRSLNRPPARPCTIDDHLPRALPHVALIRCCSPSTKQSCFSPLRSLCRRSALQAAPSPRPCSSLSPHLERPV
jgi:hypothetical protein